MPPILRSLLFVPGNAPRMLDRALNLRPDAFIPDMEDSVPWDEKANAREVVAAYAPQLAKTGVPVIPRVNSLDTGLLEGDLAAVIGPHIYGVSSRQDGQPRDTQRSRRPNPEARTEGRPAHRRYQARPLDRVRRVNRQAGRHLPLLLPDSRARPGRGRLHQRHGDRTHRQRRRDSLRALRDCHSRSCIRAYSRWIPRFFAFRDPDALRENSLASRGIGFRGRFAIHPAQIEILNQVFSPSEDEINHARRVIEAFEEAAAVGRGSTSLDGKVVDVPVVKRAQALLDQAAQMGLLE